MFNYFIDFESNFDTIFLQTQERYYRGSVRRPGHAMEVLRAALLHRRDGSIHQPFGLALQDKEEGGGQCKEGAVEKVRTFRWELWHF